MRYRVVRSDAIGWIEGSGVLWSGWLWGGRDEGRESDDVDDVDAP